MSDARPGTWSQLKRHQLALLSIAVVTVMTLACFAAPIIAPYEFDAIDLANIRQAPSLAHPMGTDDLGRDLLTRVLYGGRVSIMIGIIAALFGTTVGTLFGALGGYYGGRIDNILMRITDVAYSIPTLPLLIVLSSYTQASGWGMALIIGLLSWMATARVVRGEVLGIRRMLYVDAARSLGASDMRIISQQVLPNALGTNRGQRNARRRLRNHHRIVVEFPGTGRATANSDVGQPANGCAIHDGDKTLADHLPWPGHFTGRACRQLHR